MIRILNPARNMNKVSYHKQHMTNMWSTVDTKGDNLQISIRRLVIRVEYLIFLLVIITCFICNVTCTMQVVTEDRH